MESGGEEKMEENGNGGRKSLEEFGERKQRREKMEEGEKWGRNYE